MTRVSFLVILFLSLYPGSVLFGNNFTCYISDFPLATIQDSLKENQVLYNGRIWRNLYYQVNENQFLFTNEFISGSVTISGKTFRNVNLKFDIFKDEILTPLEPGRILQLNKELVDSFSLSFLNKTYRFVKFRADSINGQMRYFNVLYNGKTALYLKYSKKIDKLSIDGQYDKFYQFTRIYLLKENAIYPISGKGDLLRVMNNKKEQIRDFIRKNKLTVSEKDPESLVAVVRYYDSLSQ